MRTMLKVFEGIMATVLTAAFMFCLKPVTVYAYPSGTPIGNKNVVIDLNGHKIDRNLGTGNAQGNGYGKVKSVKVK